MSDPADAALKLIKSRDYAEKIFAQFIEDWAKIQKEQAGLEKAGVGATEAVTLLKKLRERYQKFRGEFEKFEKAMDLTIRDGGQR